MKIFKAFEHTPRQICAYSLFIQKMRCKKYSINKIHALWLISDEYDIFTNEFICEQVRRDFPEEFKNEKEFYRWMKFKEKVSIQSESSTQLKKEYKDKIEALV